MAILKKTFFLDALPVTSQELPTNGTTILKNSPGSGAKITWVQIQFCHRLFILSPASFLIYEIRIIIGLCQKLLREVMDIIYVKSLEQCTELL